MALKDFVAGEVLTAADVDTYLVNTIFARKTATESVTSDTTLQDDDHLTVSVAANSVYEVTFGLYYDGASGAGRLKADWVVPSGATFDYVVSHLLVAAVANTEDMTLYENIGSLIRAGTLGAGTTLGVTGLGLLIVGGTAGTFKLQWAQDSSSATATRLFAPSYICLRRAA